MVSDISAGNAGQKKDRDDFKTELDIFSRLG